MCHLICHAVPQTSVSCCFQTRHWRQALAMTNRFWLVCSCLCCACFKPFCQTRGSGSRMGQGRWFNWPPILRVISVRALYLTAHTMVTTKSTFRVIKCVYGIYVLAAPQMKVQWSTCPSILSTAWFSHTVPVIAEASCKVLSCVEKNCTCSLVTGSICHVQPIHLL